MGVWVKGAQEGLWNQEAYLLFPVHMDGTLLDNLNNLQAENQFFPTITVLHIFRQVLSLCLFITLPREFSRACVWELLRAGWRMSQRCGELWYLGHTALQTYLAMGIGHWPF